MDHPSDRATCRAKKQKQRMTSSAVNSRRLSLIFALLLSLLSRMLYTELLQLWDESVQAMDAKDWQGALAKLELISEPTSRTLFNAAAAHLALGQLDGALKVCVMCVCLMMKGGGGDRYLLFQLTFITAHETTGTMSSNGLIYLYL